MCENRGISLFRANALYLLAAAGLVFTTEKSILNPIQKSGRKVYDTAREDMARRHEIHAAKAEDVYKRQSLMWEPWL